jgi:hypothetical protein
MVIKVTPFLAVNQVYHLENFKIESSEIMHIYKCQELVPKHSKVLKKLLRFQCPNIPSEIFIHFISCK